MSDPTVMRVVNYHYVRDLPRTRFPNIKGMLLDDFRKQTALLAERYEPATLESMQAFLAGEYQPKRDLCLLTFDDGLKEHWAEVTPILVERKFQGVFFLTTACIENHHVLSVHKNHFLMASMEFDRYRQAFLRCLADLHPTISTVVDREEAIKTYRFDTPDVAEFKLLLNFRLNDVARTQVLNALFAEFLGDERAFASELYISWEEARAMQAAGMMLGGHSHRHVALATLDDAAQWDDLRTCTRLLRENTSPQAAWPFSYPYGNPINSYNATTRTALLELGYNCAFTTQPTTTTVGNDSFALPRFDTTEVKSFAT